jgi:hypothetical protein
MGIPELVDGLFRGNGFGAHSWLMRMRP